MGEVYSPGGSEFKHKGVKGIIVNMHEFVGKHKLSIREKIKAQYKKFMEFYTREGGAGKKPEDADAGIFPREPAGVGSAVWFSGVGKIMEDGVAGIFPREPDGVGSVV